MVTLFSSPIMDRSIPGLLSFNEKFSAVLESESWHSLSISFSQSSRILLVGNGGNLAVCDHGAIDISRLTDKNASAPGSGILASSLINDTSHDLWVRNWVDISLRGMIDMSVKSTLLIGVSSSGYSKNICTALDFASSKGAQSYLISATQPKIFGNYRTILLNVDQYHTAEVLTLALIYQLIHESGFTCPSISSSSHPNSSTIDYSR